MRKNILLTNSRKSLTGYDNVSYENHITQGAIYGYVYLVPLQGIHFFQNSIGGNAFLISPISPYELYNNLTELWTTLIFPTTPAYNLAENNWGRYYTQTQAAQDFWQSTGNLGFKTIAEYNTLLSQMDNVTKRNLVGTPVY